MIQNLPGFRMAIRLNHCITKLLFEYKMVHLSEFGFDFSKCSNQMEAHFQMSDNQMVNFIEFWTIRLPEKINQTTIKSISG